VPDREPNPAPTPDPDRRCGVEIEFTGLEIGDAARVLVATLGGRLDWVGTYVAKIQGSEIGEIGLELDTRFAKTPEHPDFLDKLIETLASRDEAVELLADLVPLPLELVTAPIRRDQFPALQRALDALAAAGAAGTKSGTLYAFGMHLNPERTGDAALDLRIAAAYAFAEAWLRREIEPDNARRVTPFIDPVSRRYVLALADAYETGDMTLQDFVPLYAHFNPDRNRGLDMWPLLGHLDRKLAEAHHDGDIKGIRPAFHYRLPDSRLGEPGWSPLKDLQRWERLEAAARDPAAFKRLREVAKAHALHELSTGAYLARIGTVLG